MVGALKSQLAEQTDEGKEYTIKVQEGLDDLVREYFRQRVVITGLYDQLVVHLSDVVAVEQR